MRFWKRSAFTLVIMGLCIVFLITSLTYGPITRALPLAVSIAGILLALVLLAGEIRPDLRRYFTVAYYTKETGAASSKTLPQSGKNLAITIGWSLVFFLLIVFFGFVIGTGVSLFAYLRWYRGISWLKSALVGGTVTLFIYLVFDLVLKLWLFPGILFGGLITY